MELSARGAIRVLGTLALLFVFAKLALWLGSFSRPALDFDIGPSTGLYLEGFTESEERLPVTFRWTGERATITLPLEGRSDEARLTLRFARFLPGTAHVRLFVNGRLEASFSARSGRFRTVELPLSAPSGRTDLRTLGFLVEDPAPERLGIAVDWIRIENARWSLPSWSLAPFFLTSGVFALALALAFSLPRAAALGALAGGTLATWFAVSPFAMTHVTQEITALALVATGGVAFALGRGPAARWVPLLFLLGLMLKAQALFHPSYFYPDVRLHRRHVEAMRQATGSLVERGIEAQKSAHTAYPRRIAGRNYALPYSPVFYVPFVSLERGGRDLEALMKRTGLVLAAAELPLVFLLARCLLGAEAALWAALLTPFLPPVTSRLLFAQWPTLAGHLFDVIAIFFAAHHLRSPKAWRPFVAFSAAGFASCLTYISSLFNLSLFSAFLALVTRRRFVLLGMWAAIGLSTVALLYLPFVRVFSTEILPALLKDGRSLGATPGAGLLGSLERIPLFYGAGFPALAVAGLVLCRHRPEAFRLLLVYGASFLALLALRAWSGAFKDLKELVFAGPFIAVTAGTSLRELASRGRLGTFAAIAVAIGLTAFGLSKIVAYGVSHTQLAGLP